MAWGSVDGAVLRAGGAGVTVAGARLVSPVGGAACASLRKCWSGCGQPAVTSSIRSRRSRGKPRQTARDSETAGAPRRHPTTPDVDADAAAQAGATDGAGC